MYLEEEYPIYFAVLAMKTTAKLGLQYRLGWSKFFVSTQNTYTSINTPRLYSHLLTPTQSVEKRNIIIFINIHNKVLNKVASCCLPVNKRQRNLLLWSLYWVFFGFFYCLFNSQVLIIWCSKVQTSSIYFDKVSKKLFVCFQRWKYFKSIQMSWNSKI